MTEYIVYWIDDGSVNFEVHHDVSEGLKFCESLRKLRREGWPIRHITMSVENPDMVGELGVDVTGPDYDWKKRRK